MTKECILCKQPIKRDEPLNLDVRKVVEAMKAYDLSVPELAARIGVSKRAVYRWLDNAFNPFFKIKNIYFRLLELEDLNHE